MPRKPSPEIRPTRATRRVLVTLLTGADRLDGLALARLAGIAAPRVYTVLDRLEDAGWAEGRFEQHFETPRHRYYKLTRSGRAKTIGLLRPFGLTMPEGDA